MVKIWKKEGRGLVNVQELDGFCWMDVRCVTKEEILRLENEQGIHPDHLQDILDADEQSRIEKEDEYTMVVLRLPVYDTRFEVAFYTVPVGVILKPDLIITICQADSDVLGDLVANKVRDLNPRNRAAFILQLFSRAALVYLRYLKEINRRTTIIERELQRSVRNNELVQLLSIQKSLVYFTTSLKSNEILLEKLQSSRMLRFKDEESDLLEDVLNDNKQAIEMANIYSNILTGMMDAFASVISNNLNLVMWRLTSVSIVLMLSTFIVSAFSMNVEFPLKEVRGAFYIIVSIAAAAGFVGALLMRNFNGRSLRAARSERTADSGGARI